MAAEVSDQDRKAGEAYAKALALAKKEEGSLEPERLVATAALLEEAYQLGSSDAATAIANWLHYGIYYEKNAMREVALVRFAEEKGHPEATFCLAAMYEKGVASVLRVNKRKAFSLYMKAALLGNLDAYFEVRRCFYWGIGTLRNRFSAQIWQQRGKQLGGSPRKR